MLKINRILLWIPRAQSRIQQPMETERGDDANNEHDNEAERDSLRRQRDRL